MEEIEKSGRSDRGGINEEQRVVVIEREIDNEKYSNHTEL